MNVLSMLLKAVLEWVWESYNLYLTQEKAKRYEWQAKSEEAKRKSLVTGRRIEDQIKKNMMEVKPPTDAAGWNAGRPLLALLLALMTVAAVGCCPDVQVVERGYMPVLQVPERPELPLEPRKFSQRENILVHYSLALEKAIETYNAEAKAHNEANGLSDPKTETRPRTVPEPVVPPVPTYEKPKPLGPKVDPSKDKGPQVRGGVDAECTRCSGVVERDRATTAEPGSEGQRPCSACDTASAFAAEADRGPLSGGGEADPGGANVSSPRRSPDGEARGHRHRWASADERRPAHDAGSVRVRAGVGAAEDQVSGSDESPGGARTPVRGLAARALSAPF